MHKGGAVRILLSAALLLFAASCSQYQGWGPGSLVWTPPPGQLTLSNYRFEHAAVEAMVTAAPECAMADPSASAPTGFELPFKGSRVIIAAPSADVCWRRQLASGQWSDWNRAFTGSGRFIDSQL
jgi:hypothetical protein